jgi:SnoaL-like protein
MTLQERVQRIEDIEEIKRLKSLYSHYCDTGWDGAGSDPDAAADLFVEEGVFETPMTGRIEGREAIREDMRRFGLRFRMALHMMATPRIEVAGDRAHAVWHGLNALQSPDGQALWSGGTYEEEYVRTADGWRYLSVRRRTAFLTPYEDGWGVTRNAGVPHPGARD